MTSPVTFHPAAKQVARVVPLQLLIPVAIFAYAQFRLAKLAEPAMAGLTSVAALAVVVLLIGWFAFLRNAKVTLGDDGSLTVVDWTGRVCFRARRDRVHIALLSLQDYGSRREVAILSDGSGAATPLWRATWGHETIRRLEGAIRGPAAEAKFTPVSKHVFRERYRRVQVANLPAIGLVAAGVIAVAFIIRRT